jgi:hypothetical protein
VTDTTPTDTLASGTAAGSASAAATDQVTTASAAAPASDAERLPRPRIRIGAVLWGLVLLAVGGSVLWLASSPTRRADALDAVLGLDGFGWAFVIVVTLGATITLLALAAIIRRLQHH